MCRLSDKHTLAERLPRNLGDSVHSEPGNRKGMIQALMAAIHRRCTAILKINN